MQCDSQSEQKAEQTNVQRQNESPVIPLVDAGHHCARPVRDAVYRHADQVWFSWHAHAARQNRFFRAGWRHSLHSGADQLFRLLLIYLERASLLGQHDGRSGDCQHPPRSS